MKQQLARVMNRPIVADATMAKLVQILSFAAAISVLTLSLWKLTRLDLTEAQLFFGVLLSVITPLLLVILGCLIPLAIARKNAR